MKTRMGNTSHWKLSAGAQYILLLLPPGFIFVFAMFCTNTRRFERRVVWFSAYWIKNPLLSRCYAAAAAAYASHHTRRGPPRPNVFTEKRLLLHCAVQRPRCTLAQLVRRTRLRRIEYTAHRAMRGTRVFGPSVEKPYDKPRTTRIGWR